MKSQLSDPMFHNEEAAFAYLEAKLWPNGPVCPHCKGTQRINRLHGKAHRPGLHKCYACRKQFTVRQGSVFESSHAPLHIWLQAFYMMCSSKKGIATRQLQRTFGGSMKTAWFLGHRIREAMKENRDLFSEPMGGAGETLEVDDTFIGGKSANRAYGPIPPKASVMSLVQRDGGVRSFHVPNITAATLRPIIARHASADSRYMSDEAPTYRDIGWNFAGGSGSVNHSISEYVRGDAHTNTVEGYFSILKRGIYGCYFHVSEAHLGRYLAEFDFRYSNRVKLGVDDVARTARAVAGAKGKRLTYRTTRGGRSSTASTEAGA
jgi:transposase-like protein